MEEKINLLKVTPCHNEHTKAEQEGKTIVPSFPRFKRSQMSRYLLPKGMSKDIHVRLEEHGTTVWNLIDDQWMVRKIIEKPTDYFQHETGCKSRVSTYLS